MNKQELKNQATILESLRNMYVVMDALKDNNTRFLDNMEARIKETEELLGEDVSGLK